MKRPRNSFIGFIATIGLAVAGCATQPATPIAHNDDGEPIEVEQQKESNAPLWLGLAALAVGIIALADDGGSDSGGGQDCYWVIGGDGRSVKVCD